MIQLVLNFILDESVYSCLCLYLNVAQCLFYVIKEVIAR